MNNGLVLNASQFTGKGGSAKKAMGDEVRTDPGKTVETIKSPQDAQRKQSRNPEGATYLDPTVDCSYTYRDEAVSRIKETSRESGKERWEKELEEKLGAQSAAHARMEAEKRAEIGKNLNKRLEGTREKESDEAKSAAVLRYTRSEVEQREKELRSKLALQTEPLVRIEAEKREKELLESQSFPNADFKGSANAASTMRRSTSFPYQYSGDHMPYNPTINDGSGVDQGQSMKEKGESEH